MVALLIFIYLFVGCIRTAWMLADIALETDDQYVNIPAGEMGFSVLFWGVNVVANVLANIFVMTYWYFRGDDE